MFMHQPQSPPSELLSGLIQTILALWHSLFGAPFICTVSRKVSKLTGTLGSDTAMLSGKTVAFTHWLREAAKRYGSSARSHRFL